MATAKNIMIAVIIPYCDSADFLPETLRSVSNQTHKNIEIILVDDGSQREPLTSAMVEPYVAKYKIIYQENQGPAVARNTGILAANSNYIVTLDSDDTLEPTYLEKCLATLIKYPDLGFAYTGAQYFDKYVHRIPMQDYNFYLLLRHNFLLCAALFRKEAWKAVGGFSPDFKSGREDWNFWISLGERGWYGKLIPEYLFNYRQRSVSRQMGARGKDREIRQKIRGRHAELFSKANLVELKKEWGARMSVATRVRYFLKDVMESRYMPQIIRKKIRNAYHGAKSILSTWGIHLSI